ncbi:TetR family transcriptional regulator, partial [Streptomyces sp. NPDC056728]
VQEISELLGQVRPMATVTTLATSAERLTLLVEGISMRWLSGILPLEHARELMLDAVDAELGRLERR